LVTSIGSVNRGDHADAYTRRLNRYTLLALPVTDDDGCLCGIIMVDDLMDRLLPPERRRRAPNVLVEAE
jgi:Mg/Co/Ni transporter MgtE